MQNVAIQLWRNRSCVYVVVRQRI